MSAAGATRWATAENGTHGLPAVLLMPIGAEVVYSVTLPPDARIVADCDVTDVPGAAAGTGTAAVEFTARVVGAGTEVESACRVSARGGLSPQSCRVWLRGIDAGPVTITLRTRAVGGAPQPSLLARWRNPRVEWPRRRRDLAMSLREALRHLTLRDVTRGAAVDDERQYRSWVREQEPSRRTLRAQRTAAASLAAPLRFTLITLEADPARASAARASLLSQTYPHWEWLVVSSPLPECRDPRESDPRIRVIAANAAATPAARFNQALGEARGEFIAVLGAHDVLAVTALFEIASALERSAPDVLYTDEDRIGDDGRRSKPAFKPDWSPELMLAYSYVGRLALIRTVTARNAGGYREGFGSGEEWELLLRLSRSGSRFARLAACLYHRGASAPEISRDDRARVLSDHGSALGLRLEVSGPDAAARVRWSVNSPKVSVIIPSRNACEVLQKCLDGLLEGTSYPNREVIVVDNGSTDQSVLSLYARLERAHEGRVVPFDRPFNYSAACNAGAAAATGELLLFLNNDIEVIEPDWLEELVRWALRPGVGIVGAKLLYPDGLIQHAGVVFGLGLVGHIFARAADGTRGVFGSTDSYRNYLAVTGACQMMSRQVFERLGGYDERFRLSFSDVVLCMEAWRHGYRVVYTPFARLIHHESYTRKRDDSVEDLTLLARYLRDTGFRDDPYFHPGLEPKSPIPAVRSPFDAAPAQVIADNVARVLAPLAAR